MAKFPICQICAAMLPDESVEQKHYDWHSTHDKKELRAKIAALLKAAQDESDGDVVRNPWYRTAIETRAYQRVLDLIDEAGS